MATSPTSGPGGGGDAPTTRAEYEGNAVTIANNGIFPLTWDTKDIGTELLDRTDPATPTVLVAGVYGITVVLQGADLTVGGYFEGTLHVDVTGDSIQVGGVPSVPANASLASPRVSLAVTYYLPAGAQIQADAHNVDGAAARDFTIVAAVIQRIS